MKDIDFGGIALFIFLSVAVFSMAKCSSDIGVAEQKRFQMRDSLQIIYGK